jgi:hypothetical protein
VFYCWVCFPFVKDSVFIWFLGEANLTNKILVCYELYIDIACIANEMFPLDPHG